MLNDQVAAGRFFCFQCMIHVTDYNALQLELMLHLTVAVAERFLCGNTCIGVWRGRLEEGSQSSEPVDGLA
jgi:hypothetical protein